MFEKPIIMIKKNRTKQCKKKKKTFPFIAFLLENQGTRFLQAATGQPNVVHKTQLATNAAPHLGTRRRGSGTSTCDRYSPRCRRRLEAPAWDRAPESPTSQGPIRLSFTCTGTHTHTHALTRIYTHTRARCSLESSSGVRLVN